MSRKGQVSIEYILIMGVAFMLTVPLFAVFQAEQNRISDSITDAQIEKAGRVIADAANSVHYYGEPAKQTIRVYFPESIKQVTIDGKSIIFLIDSTHGDYEWPISADVDLTGSLGTYEGIHVIEVNATPLGKVSIND